MKIKSFVTFTGIAAMLALGLSGAAQAQAVYWSVGLSSPGVQLGVSSAPPVLMLQPGYQPVYVAPRPVYVGPPRVVYLRPAPVVLQPVPQYIRADWRYPDHRHGWQHQRHEMERAEHGGRS
ncbi:MAG: hypothetical protein WCK94_14100 [Comamonadaceae bacterium]|jgi:hypothetical protein